MPYEKTQKNTLRTLNYINFFLTQRRPHGITKDAHDLIKGSHHEDLRQEAIKIFKNLQGPDTIYPIILDIFPEKYKGGIAKDWWHNTEFKVGAEYGMLSMLFWLMNLTEEDIYGKRKD